MIIDAVIIGLALILGIKGFFNGIVREISGLIGIIGGLYLASVFYHPVGVYINENLFEIKNKSAVDLVGFITVFVGVWLGVIFLGFIISKLLEISALGIIDKILGFLFGALKFFLLISVIVALLYRVEFVREKIQRYVKNSIVFPICLEVGRKILNLSPKDLENLAKNVKISKN